MNFVTYRLFFTLLIPTAGLKSFFSSQLLSIDGELSGLGNLVSSAMQHFQFRRELDKMSMNKSGISASPRLWWWQVMILFKSSFRMSMMIHSVHGHRKQKQWHVIWDGPLFCQLWHGMRWAMSGFNSKLSHLSRMANLTYYWCVDGWESNDVTQKKFPADQQTNGSFWSEVQTSVKA